MGCRYRKTGALSPAATTAASAIVAAAWSCALCQSRGASEPLPLRAASGDRRTYRIRLAIPGISDVEAAVSPLDHRRV